MRSASSTGQGSLPPATPPRQRHFLILQPGATLGICSDGLFEATAAQGSAAQYGYARPRELLAELAGRPAADVLDGLLVDWRRHRGPGAPADDTTIIVLRCLPAEGAPRDQQVAKARQEGPLHQLVSVRSASGETGA